eukprot:TRINITY_DN10028_c0_g1_i1.p1 TRINITY_DN10028_c0_g1~~TRINITY_DN10028_c0_g1_i1.p1  ORF type:complete len:1277 (+),score=138.07 TRINITY_DN10028_c0_g1_i1:60-3890(+)
MGRPRAASVGFSHQRSAFSTKVAFPPCSRAHIANFVVVTVILCTSFAHGIPIRKSTSTSSSRKGGPPSEPAQNLPNVSLCEYVISSPSKSKAQRVNLYHNAHSNIPTQPGTYLSSSETFCISDLNHLSRQEKAFLHGWSAQRTLSSSEASTTAALSAAANVLQSEGISSTLPETGETLLRKIAPLPKKSPWNCRQVFSKPRLDVHYLDLLQVVREWIASPKHYSSILRNSNQPDSDFCVRDDLHSGLWFLEATQKASRAPAIKSATLLSVILYADSTQLFQVGSRNVHPVYMTLGNFDSELRRSPEGWRVVGFIPELPQNGPATPKYHPKENWKTARRMWSTTIMNRCLSFMLQSLDAIQLVGDCMKTAAGDVRHFLPTLALYTGDYPELQHVAGCKLFDCRSCAFRPTVLNLVGLFADRYKHEEDIDSEIDRQTRTDRYTAFVEARPGLPSHGLVKLPNPFRNQLHFSRFRNTPTDILHGLSGGVGEKLVQIFLKHLHSQGGDARVDEFDRWIAWTTSQPWSYKKRYNLSNMKASGTFCMEKQKRAELHSLLPYAATLLLNDENPADELLLSVIFGYQQIVSILRQETISEEQLFALARLCDQWRPQAVALFAHHNLKFVPKIHRFTDHLPIEVALFGVPAVFDTAVQESFHRILKEFAFWGVKSSDIGRTVRNLMESELRRVSLLMSGVQIPTESDPEEVGDAPDPHVLGVGGSPVKRFSVLQGICRHLGNEAIATEMNKHREDVRVLSSYSTGRQIVRSGAFVSLGDSVCRVHFFTIGVVSREEYAVVTRMTETNHHDVFRTRRLCPGPLQFVSPAELGAPVQLIPLAVPERFDESFPRGKIGWNEFNSKLDGDKDWIRRTDWETLVRDANAVSREDFSPAYKAGFPFCPNQAVFPAANDSAHFVTDDDPTEDLPDSTSILPDLNSIPAYGAAFCALAALFTKLERSRGSAEDSQAPAAPTAPPPGQGVFPLNRGISNFGNSCFLAVIHQLLFHSIAFRQRLCSHLSHAADTAAPIAVLLGQHFAYLEAGTPRWSPILNALPKGYFSDEYNLAQQDAREYLSHLQSTFENCFTSPVAPQRVFQGLRRTIRTCPRCQSCTSRSEGLFDSLLVPVLEDSDMLTRNVVDTVRITEVLSGVHRGLTCSTCDSVDAVDTYSYSSLPECLLIHLQREGHAETQPDETFRINAPVDISENLHLPTASTIHKYRLYCILNHISPSSSFGHWTTWCRPSTANENHPFFLFDDEAISVSYDFATIARLSRSQSAMLVYARVDE